MELCRYTCASYCVFNFLNVENLCGKFNKIVSYHVKITFVFFLFCVFRGYQAFLWCVYLRPPSLHPTLGPSAFVLNSPLGRSSGLVVMCTTLARQLGAKTLITAVKQRRTKPFITLAVFCDTLIHLHLQDQTPITVKMGYKCIMYECQNGYDKKTKELKAQGIKKPSVFQVPKVRYVEKLTCSFCCQNVCQNELCVVLSYVHHQIHI